ncbi:hypothetical protein [Streptomyces xanthii]|uniref:SWIM-type domain-containing protein n=1 Tax=Streptomyces xanthii TaxID=2768069 RepID=A0A7H1BEY0_9ACTN|nr:hypothetical protein [Streptomyces xanthii]QNS07285.1 hypothetical protein IAG42_29255 [Streptomyces xanthii]
MTTAGLPPVLPDVTAEIVEALTPRLAKRLDAAVAKLAARPHTVDPASGVHRIAVDEESNVELRPTDGIVTTPDAIHCDCLLSPACVHRAAAATLAPVAVDAVQDMSAEPEPEQESEPRPESGPGAEQNSTEATTGPPAHPEPSPSEQPSTPAHDTTEHTVAAHALWTAAARLLDAGVDGAGAVAQAGLLRAAHIAKVAGLHRPAAAAIRVVNGVRAARGADPAHRTAELADALTELLGIAHALGTSGTDPAATAALRGTARRSYAQAGSLRLYGLFTEPVLTATGHAGCVTWTADADGTLYQVPDIAPGGANRARGVADRAVRLGDTALTHRELSAAGLVVSGATVAEDGRLGAGKAVQAVRAKGADWTEPPLDALWSVPLADQAARARRSPDGLLFLDATLGGVLRERDGESLVAHCQGVTVRLAVAHDDPGLAHRENLTLLASAPGTRVRLIARLVPSTPARVMPLAVRLPSGARHDLGLDRLTRADLPVPTASGGEASPGPLPGTPPPPVHPLRRRVEQSLVAGRRALTLARPDEAPALRRAGLPTAAVLLEALLRAAADRGRDPFGRLAPADLDAFARTWLACARYTQEVTEALGTEAWKA